MKLQYLSGHRSITRGFLIPIGEWSALKAKPRWDEREELPEIPEWQIELLRERFEAYENGLEEELDLEEAMKEIEQDLQD